MTWYGAVVTRTHCLNLEIIPQNDANQSVLSGT